MRVPSDGTLKRLLNILEFKCNPFLNHLLAKFEFQNFEFFLVSVPSEIITTLEEKNCEQCLVMVAFE